jgi:hypothetical protein
MPYQHVTFQASNLAVEGRLLPERRNHHGT